MPGGWRTWVEVICFLATVVGCLIAFYQVLGPTLREDERAQLTDEIVTALKAEGVEITVAPGSTGTEIGTTIAAAVAEVRDVRNAFELKAGESKEVTDHGILVTNLGVKNSDGRVDQVRGGIAGEVFQMTLGVAYPLPAPAQNCTVAMVELINWWGIWRDGEPDKATFRVRCS